MPNLHPDETQLSTTIAKDIKERLEHLSIDDLKTYRAKLEYLIEQEYERQTHPRELARCPRCGEVLTAHYPTPTSLPYCIRCGTQVEQPRQLVDSPVQYRTAEPPVTLVVLLNPEEVTP